MDWTGTGLFSVLYVVSLLNINVKLYLYNIVRRLSAAECALSIYGFADSVIPPPPPTPGLSI